jgi:transposase-like protein
LQRTLSRVIGSNTEGRIQDGQEPGQYSNAVKRELAIEMLVQGSSQSAVAHELGVDRATVYRWLRNPDFVAELNAAKKELIAVARGKVRQLYTPAIDKIIDLMENGPPKVQLEAAKCLLHMGGFDEPDEIGPTDPADVKHEQAVRAYAKTLQLP